jgi:hypothetical protein
MQHTSEFEIRRHPGGSIDTAHYARIGRELHGKGVRDAARSLMRCIGNEMRLMGRQRTTLADTVPPAPVYSAAE